MNAPREWSAQASRPRATRPIRTGRTEVWLRLILREHYSLRTERSYCHWIKAYIHHHGLRHPAELGAAEVEAYLTHLATQRDVAASTQNQAKHALLYLYRNVLGVDLPWLDGLTQARESRRPCPGATPWARPVRPPVNYGASSHQHLTTYLASRKSLDFVYPMDIIDSWIRRIHRASGTGLEMKMERSLFNIRRVETTKNFLSGPYVSVSFALEYKGVEINRFGSMEAAENCLEEGVAVRSDAQWAYEDALRQAGYDIPSDEQTLEARNQIAEELLRGCPEMTNFKFTRRQATISEIESIGFVVKDGQARSHQTGAWYAVQNFLVSNSATIDGERKFGQFLYLDDDLPAAERVLVELHA